MIHFMSRDEFGFVALQPTSKAEPNAGMLQFKHKHINGNVN